MSNTVNIHKIVVFQTLRAYFQTIQIIQTIESLFQPF